MSNNYFEDQNDPTPIKWPKETWFQKRRRFLSLPKFDNVFCSQCGQDFGPGDHGYSHCQDHRRDFDQRFRSGQGLGDRSGH